VSFRLSLRDRANLDIEEIALAIGRQNVGAAMRFYDAVWDAFEKLGAMPGIGAAREIANDRLEDLRCWPIRSFENYLIFYIPIERGIDVVRVLHGARDVDAILARE
jgi:toxin ParE1/3/4